jgi:hypothetical protein
MSSNSRNYSKDFRAVMNAIAESVIQESDEDTISEAKELGINLKSEADSVRTIFKGVLKSERQKKLVAAQKTYQEQSQALKKRTYSIPTSASDRRSLLNTVLNKRPELRQGILTAQHREFIDLPDEDVEGILKQLQLLGVLDENTED